MSERVPTVEEFEALALRVTELEERIAGQQTSWPEWMSSETAAAYLDVSPERLAKAKQRGTVPFHQVGPGCRVFYSRRDLDEWMRAQRTKASSVSTTKEER